MSFFAICLVAICDFSLPSCTVGPDYHPPRTELPPGYAGLGPVPRADSRTLPGDPRAVDQQLTRWWSVFNDPRLASLIDRAAAANLDLARAEARILQARAQRRIAAAGDYPTVDASGSATRSRGAGAGGPNRRVTTGNAFREGFDASWEIDVFGGVRRAVESAEAGIDAAIEDRRNTLVTLEGDVATAYFDLRGAQLQEAIARRNLAAQTETLELTQRRFEAGFVSALDVANAQAQVADTTSRLPIFESTQRQAIYALGVLLGQEPASLLPELAEPAPLPGAPDEVPVGIPSELLRRRPDIRRAEADLHAQVARIGIAEADLYPRFFINGSLGLSGAQVESLSTLADRFWSIGPSARWTVFDGGRIRANVALQQAGAEEAFLAYRQTVLVALQDVESSLVRFNTEQQRRAALRDSVDANRRAVDLATQLYTEGRTDFLNVLTAQRQLFSSEDQLAASETNVASNLVSLYKALGGGWVGGEQ